MSFDPGNGLYVKCLQVESLSKGNTRYLKCETEYIFEIILKTIDL